MAMNSFMQGLMGVGNTAPISGASIQGGIDNANEQSKLQGKEELQKISGLPENEQEAEFLNSINDYYNSFDFADLFQPGQKDKDKIDFYKDIMATKFNEQENKKFREWSEHMSNTQVQRRMKDLEAAGINPALALLNGGALQGAEMPSGQATRFSQKSKITDSKARPVKDAASIIAALAIAAKFLV